MVPNEECGRHRQYHFLDENKQICAGGVVGKDSCNGDSGGPLYSSKNSKNGPYYLYGIGEVIWEFWPQEGAGEIPVPKWSDQGDALVSHLKKPLNFENSNSWTVIF